MALYQLTLFYPNIREQQAALRKIRQDVEIFAGNNYRVMSAGEQVCAIGFVSEISPDRLRDNFQKYGSEFFQFLLVEVSEAVAGYLPRGTWQWLASHRDGKQAKI